jgi:translation elongation factor EF-1alpha
MLCLYWKAIVVNLAMMVNRFGYYLPVSGWGGQNLVKIRSNMPIF